MFVKVETREKPKAKVETDNIKIYLWTHSIPHPLKYLDMGYLIQLKSYDPI